MLWRGALAVAAVGALLLGCRYYGDGYGCGAAAGCGSPGAATDVHAHAEPGAPVEQEPWAADPPHGGPVADGGGPPPSQSRPVRAAVYTCPMHPEVVRAAPGPCPKCGMALVAKR